MESIVLDNTIANTPDGASVFEHPRFDFHGLTPPLFERPANA